MKKIYLLIAVLISIHSTSSFGQSAGSPVKGITVAGGMPFGSAPNQLQSPTGIFVDTTGNMYIADENNHRIQKWAPGASSGITVAGGAGVGSAANQLSGPTDVFVDPAGNIFIADRGNNRIQKWAPGASSGITVAGGGNSGSAPHQLNGPSGVFVDAAGSIYIADTDNHRIQKWAVGALGITVAGFPFVGSSATQLNRPTDVFVDAAGNVYISDLNNRRIQKWLPGATTGITVAGGNDIGPNANQFWSPNALFVDAAGTVYVADGGNHRIQRWYPGALEGITVAGGNGPGSAPDQFINPSGIFVDVTGNIFVSDNGNHRVQKFTVEFFSCPSNVIVSAPSCNEEATISWTEPKNGFPSAIRASFEADPRRRTFTYMGESDGHGYYKSDYTSLWQAARNIAGLLGGAGVNGHLATLTSAKENDFIYNQIKGTGYSPWIGLSTQTRPGRFRWLNREPVDYTNWTAGEPNNAGGNKRNVTEPYVRMSDQSGTWNDQPDDLLPFIVEFEKPLIRYKQISGPKNGSTQKPGEYQVCYQRKDLINDQTDTCCFNVTVNCNDEVVPQPGAITRNNESARDNVNKGLQIETYPNPSSSSFMLKITSNKNERIRLQVVDVLGRVVESRQRITPGQVVVIGAGYHQGIYFAQVIQGTRIVTARLIKNGTRQSD